MDGNIGKKTIAALNTVRKSFGLPASEELDAEGLAELLPPLLIMTEPDAAEALFRATAEPGLYDYTQACVLYAQGKYASAEALFRQTDYADAGERAGSCSLPWPKNGVLYKNPAIKGSSAQLCVKLGTETDTAMLVKVYTEDGVLARTMFLGGKGKATCSLPAGSYIIKDGTGRNWYGEEEAFGPDGAYEIMTFENGARTVKLQKNHIATITVNITTVDPKADSVGSVRESWGGF